MLKLAQTNQPTDQPTNQQTNQQTGQKQYVPHFYSGGHKKIFVVQGRGVVVDEISA